MREERRCKICMGDLSWDGSCEFCKDNQKKYIPKSYHIAPGSYLKNEEYQIGAVLGEGGFGITYIGFDTTLLTKVAIKEFFPIGFVERREGEVLVLNDENQAWYEKGLHKFLEEGRTLAKFGSLSGIVQVKGFFKENNTAYLIMEYIQGISVKKYVQEKGVVPSKYLLPMLEPVMRGLIAVHEAGLIHQDISCDNLMINQEGKGVLIDFGTARNPHRELERTRTIVCKPGFSAIEQYSQEGELGPWTDVYGLCATIYYMLTGKQPQNCTDRILEDKLKPLTEYEEIPLSKEKKEGIQRGLILDKKDRLATVNQLYEILFEKTALANGWEQTSQSSLSDYGQVHHSVTTSDLRQEFLNLQRDKRQKRKKKIFGAGVFVAVLMIFCVLGGFVLSNGFSKKGPHSFREKSRNSLQDTAHTIVPSTSATASPKVAPSKSPESEMTKSDAKKEGDGINALIPEQKSATKGTKKNITKSKEKRSTEKSTKKNTKKKNAEKKSKSSKKNTTSKKNSTFKKKGGAKSTKKTKKKADVNLDDMF